MPSVALRSYRWPLLALLLLLAIAGGGHATRRLFAQAVSPGATQPPGPLLGTGDYINTDSGDVTATWEEYPGGTLYLWTSASRVTRAYSGPCAGGGAAVCYTWIEYVDDLADPYNTDHWTPLQRGCLVLGADPLSVGEADGLAKVTDIYAAGDTYIAVTRPIEGEGTLNPQASGIAPAPLAWDPAGYDQCFGAGGGGSGGSAACTIAGSWQTIQSGYLPVYFVFQQNGTAISGTASAPSLNLNGTVTGTLFGNQLSIVVTWSPTLQGAYAGTVTTGQIVSGGAYQVGTSPSTAVIWSGTGPANCGGSTPGPTQPGGIAGTWDANNGVWTFTQSGSGVSATIQFSDGQGSATLQGSFSDGTLQSTWHCNSDCAVPDSGGTVTLTLSSDGCTLQGSYTSVVDGMTTGTGPLTMTLRGC